MRECGVERKADCTGPNQEEQDCNTQVNSFLQRHFIYRVASKVHIYTPLYLCLFIDEEIYVCVITYNAFSQEFKYNVVESIVNPLKSRVRFYILE